MKYIVIELQTDAGGTVGSIVSVKNTYNEAVSTYHSILAAAALSDLPFHAAVLMTSEGNVLTSECFKHGEETA